MTPTAGQTAANGTINGATAGAAAIPSANGTGVAQSSVPLASLSAAVQSAIAAQMPAGSQVTSVIQQTSADGTTTHRAQVMQNGITSELALNNIPGITASTTPGIVSTTTTGAAVPLTSGIITATPMGFDQLPVGIQGAFTAQAAGVPVSNITYTPGANGAGIYRGIANGRPIEIRSGVAGALLPATTQLATASTNQLKLDDLPLAVRDAIRANQPYAQVSSIHKSDSASGALYDLTLRTEDGISTMQIGADGTIVQANRNLAAELSTPAPVITNLPPKITFASLPVAVRDLIETKTDPKEIKSLVLTNFQNKAAFVVDYMNSDGLRDRVYINKEGLIVRTQTNLFGLSKLGEPVRLVDLPEPARIAALNATTENAITSIGLDMRGLTPVYVVNYARDGESRQMIINTDGARVESVGSAPSSVTGEESIPPQEHPVNDEEE